MSAQAIETRYAGSRFRSRLEARWAVFFDALEIRWLYEPEGYRLSDGSCYLPDFYLPDLGTWVEVKGSDDTLDSRRMKLAAGELPKLGETEGNSQILILGQLPRTPFSDFVWTMLKVYDLLDTDDIFGGKVVSPDGVRFGMWHKEQRFWIEGWSLSNISTEPIEMEGHWTGVPDAFEAFHSARFEHGESGYTKPVVEPAPEPVYEVFGTGPKFVVWGDYDVDERADYGVARDIYLRTRRIAGKASYGGEPRVDPDKGASRSEIEGRSSRARANFDAAMRSLIRTGYISVDRSVADDRRYWPTNPEDGWDDAHRRFKAENGYKSEWDVSRW